MDEDPYGSIIDLCQVSSSQEQTLTDLHTRRKKPAETPCFFVQSTGIVMMSPPDSLKDDYTPREVDEDDVFHTPPEQHSESDNPGGPTTIGALNRSDDVELVADDGDDFVGSEKTVDLGDDDDELGFSEPNLGEFRGDVNSNPVVNLSDTESIVLETESVEETQEVDLDGGEKCDELGKDDMDVDIRAKEVGCTDVEGLGKVVKEDDTNEAPGIGGADNAAANDEEKYEESGKEAKVGCGVGGRDNADKKSGKEVDEGAGVKEAEVGCGGGGSSDNVGENVGKISGGKRIEDLDKLKYVGSGGTGRCGVEGGVWRKRELPRSFQEPEKNEGLWAPRVKVKKHYKDLVACAQGRLVGGDSKGGDFFEVAKEQGIVFPRPRWWPPRDFGVQGLD